MENKFRILIREQLSRILQEDDNVDWEMYELMDKIKNEMMHDFSQKVQEHKLKHGCKLIDPSDKIEASKNQLSLFDKDKYLTKPEETKPYWDCSVVEDESDYKYKFEGRQPWTLIPIDTLKNVWWRFAKTPPGIDIPPATIKTLDKIVNILINNIFKIDVNTEMTGHQSSVPDEEEFDNWGISEEDNERWYGDYCEDDMEGQMRISDYALDKLMKKIVEFRETDDPHKRLQIADATLEVIHMRSDIAGWFVEGGSSALAQLSGYERDMVAEVRMFVREQINEALNEKKDKIFTKKFDRCVKAVKKQGEGDAAYPICMKSVGKKKAVRKSHQRADEEVHLGADVYRMDNGMDNAPMSEEINASEAHTSKNAIKTLVKGSRNIAFVTLQSDSLINRLKTKYGIDYLEVPENPYGAKVLFNPDGYKDAVELKNIANQHDGFLPSTPDKASFNTIERIGQLLGYKQTDIDTFIEKQRLKYSLNE